MPSVCLVCAAGGVLQVVGYGGHWSWPASWALS